MSIRDFIKTHAPLSLVPILRLPYLAAIWPFRYARLCKISHRAVKYLPYYQDELSRDILHDRIEYLKTGNLNVFLDRAEKEGWQFSTSLYGADGLSVSGAVIIYSKWCKNLDYTKRILTKLYGSDGFRTMTVKEFLGGGKIYPSELLVFMLYGQNTRVDNYLSSHKISNRIMFEGVTLLTEEQYVDMFSPVDNEIIVDAGAFTGDTAICFMKWAGDKLRHIYSFEFDPANAEICAANLKPYSDKVTLIPKGTWDKDETSYVATRATSGSSILQKGNTEVHLTTIDSVVGNDPVTFIKMDVEGAELKSLMGAKNTIIKNHPRLAICVYHKPEDIYEIPGYILSLVPEYKFYMRHYSSREYETVLYACCE